MYVLIGVYVQLQLQQHDEVLMFASSTDASLSVVLQEEADYIENCLRRPLRKWPGDKHVEDSEIMHQDTYTVAGSPLTLTFVKN